MLILALFAGVAVDPGPPALSARCPAPRPGEVVVCADREPTRSPYQLPRANGPVVGARGTASVSRERNALIEPDGASLGSCSAVGPGGWTGCRHREFKRNVDQAAGARDSRGRIFADSDSH